MKSKTKIEKQTIKKGSSILIQTIRLAKKNENWLEIARLLSAPRKRKIEINLDKIEKNAGEGELIIVPGKVLSQGELNKKIKIVALNFSSMAMEKILKSKSEAEFLLEEIKKNPQARGIKILK